jgi:hypothetical protein
MGYLAHNPSFKLTYRFGSIQGLDGLADSDWGNSVCRRSTTGLLARYNKSIVLWRSRMQKTIALSTAEAEYYAASEIAIEIIYLRDLLKNMGFPQADDTPVYEDNTACIEWGNHIIGGRELAKHIDIRKHFAHEVIQNRHHHVICVSSGYRRRTSWPTSLPRRCRCLISRAVWKDLCVVQRLRRDLEPPEGGENDYPTHTLARRSGLVSAGR